MRCDQIAPYLPGVAGGDLQPETARIVEQHLSGCASCRSDAARYERVRAGLAAVAAREVDAPAYLADAVLETVHERRVRRVLPVIPPPSGELIRIVQENREAIAQAAGAAIVAAGAAYALWRAMRGTRRAEPATS